ncbi:ankyrin repeat-containing domain protein [Hypoxylon sp. NC1633]|nr:ankyrin repeat-containing domain protein [Hypoxylon sp. NC1633]
MSEAFHRSIDDHNAELAKALVRGGCYVEVGSIMSILKHTSETDDLSLQSIAILYRKQLANELLALSYGADPNRRMGSESVLQIAAKVASPAVVKLLLQHGATWKNRAALHFAAMDNRVDVAAVLLQQGQGVNAIPDDEEIPAGYYDRGWGTALHEAARKGHEQMVRFSIESWR